MSIEPRWTERADEVVHDVLANYVYAEAETVEGESPPDRYDHEDATADARHDATRAVLAALADAGLLLPPGSETVEWFGVRVDVPHPGRSQKRGDIMTHFGEEKSLRCREVWHGWTPVRRTTAAYVGPWWEVEVPDA